VRLAVVSPFAAVAMGSVSQYSTPLTGELHPALAGLPWKTVPDTGLPKASDELRLGGWVLLLGEEPPKFSEQVSLDMEADPGIMVPFDASTLAVNVGYSELEKLVAALQAW
jgi:hypothetical protein